MGTTKGRMETSPKILIWDIETVMNVVATFRLMNDQPLPHRNILQERYVVSASWKWLGEKVVHSVSLLDDPKRFAADIHDDTHVVTKLHEVLSSADVIVAHNGDQYDTKFTETRILKLGLPPLPPIQSIDTLKVARNRFLFNNNRLDYLAQFLGIGHKTSTIEDLWLKVLAGDKKAIRNMVYYNKGDVRLLEEVFLKLRPYIPNYVNRQMFGQGEGCPRCGSLHTQSRGHHKTITQAYTRYQCQECGGWFRAKKADKSMVSLKVL